MKDERQLVTTNAMQEFINKFKQKIYDWTNPSGTYTENWKEVASTVEGKYKLVPASQKDILEILKRNDLLSDGEVIDPLYTNVDENDISWTYEVANLINNI